MMKMLMSVDPSVEKRMDIMNSPEERYLDRVATRYRIKTLVALKKHVWLVLQRMTLPAPWVLSCQRRRATLSSGLTRGRAVKREGSDSCREAGNWHGDSRTPTEEAGTGGASGPEMLEGTRDAIELRSC